jgi:hypothetical protein
MATGLQPAFEALSGLLRKHGAGLRVGKDTARHFSLSAPTGPATVKIWGGKLKSPMIPVAWVEIQKAYVSYHLMGVYGNPKLLDGCSKELMARMQGKSCFNFKLVDEPLFAELGRLTAASIKNMKKAGFIGDRELA